MEWNGMVWYGMYVCFSLIGYNQTISTFTVYVAGVSAQWRKSTS
jgi:hypothetical protein